MRKIRRLTAGLLAAMLLAGAMTVPAAAAGFDDVKSNDWFYDAVQYVADGGIMSGYGEGKFAPNDTLNRAMVVQVLFNLQDKPDVGSSKFVDVPASAWYCQAVSWAAGNGVVSGYGEQFKPDNQITQQEFVQILYNYAKKPRVYETLSDFIPADQADGWAHTAMTWALACGVLDDYVKADPKTQVTRAQAAYMLKAFLTRPVKTELKMLVDKNMYGQPSMGTVGVTQYNGRGDVVVETDGDYDSYYPKVNIYIYDAKGRLTQEYQEFECYAPGHADGTNVTFAGVDTCHYNTRISYEYDQWGNLTLEKRYDNKGSEELLEQEVRYAYNRKALVSQKDVYYGWDGTLLESYRYQYDEDGKLVRMDVRVNSNDEDIVHTYQYDAKGNLILDLDDSNRRTYRNVVEYSYNDRGQLIRQSAKQVSSYPTTDSGYPVYTYTYEYNEKGQLTRKETSEGVSISHYEELYTYREDGQPDTYRKHDYRGGGDNYDWSFDKAYAYDREGRLILSYDRSGVDTVEYDKDGNLTRLVKINDYDFRGRVESVEVNVTADGVTCLRKETARGTEEKNFEWVLWEYGTVDRVCTERDYDTWGTYEGEFYSEFDVYGHIVKYVSRVGQASA